jgi:hypothetical protein
VTSANSDLIVNIYTYIKNIRLFLIKNFKMRKPEIKEELKPKDFIKICLIEEIGSLIANHPFLSFNLICCGIEFIGRCIDDNNGFEYKYNDKNKNENLRIPFDLCITTYMKKYKPLIGTDYDLYSCLRCGFAHQFMPKNKLSLAPVDSTDKDLDDLSDGKKVLHIKEFYESFKFACEQIINNIDMGTFYKNPKMYKTFLIITD